MHSEQSQPQQSVLASDGSHARNPRRQIVAFLFAHQDDEVAVFSCIEDAIRRGDRVLCIFLTDGNFRANQSALRDAESRQVLLKIGVDLNDIHFVGSIREFTDGALLDHLDDAFAEVSAILDPLSDINGLYMHAWEGGHQDHDAVHLIGVTYANKAELLGVSRQFALYRAARNLLKIALFAPLAENGPVSVKTIPPVARLRYLWLSLSYPSQWKTWVVLFPLLAYSYCTKPAQATQRVSVTRLLARPHAGPLLYERRGHLHYDEFRAAANTFMRRYIPGLFRLNDKS